jgi:hypothetical protein
MEADEMAPDEVDAPADESDDLLPTDDNDDDY